MSSNFQTGVEIIKKLKPDIYVKGRDYKDNKQDKTKGIYKEINELKK